MSEAMASLVEDGVLFLDRDLVEPAAACLPGLESSHGGKGILKDFGCRILPAEVVDRPKGYFPVPALVHLEGPILSMACEVLHAPEARQRGLFRAADYVKGLLGALNATTAPRGSTYCGSRDCWRCGCSATAGEGPDDRGTH